MASTIRELSGQDFVSIADLYTQVRARTMQIVAPLEIEDYVIQTADFMSPPRWHIGHTSWFFETVPPGLQTWVTAFTPKTSSSISTLITKVSANVSNARNAAPNRARPSKKLSRIAIISTNRFSRSSARQTLCAAQRLCCRLVRLGLEHEMQHQELLVYDIKHLLCDQFAAPLQPLPQSSRKVEGMAEIEGGLIWLGYDKKRSAAVTSVCIRQRETSAPGLYP
jgi:hypothetical protein